MGEVPPLISSNSFYICIVFFDSFCRAMDFERVKKQLREYFPAINFSKESVDDHTAECVLDGFSTSIRSLPEIKDYCFFIEDGNIVIRYVGSIDERSDVVVLIILWVSITIAIVSCLFYKTTTAL